MKKSQYITKILISVAMLSFVSLFSHSALASGFKLPVQNITNMGVAYAGTAALAIDASTNFYNPAGLVRLDEEQIVAGLAFNLPTTRVDVTRATSSFGNLLSPSSGQTVPSNGSLIPLVHYALRINDSTVFGFSCVTAFGTRNNYLPDSIVRYISTKSQLSIVDLGPSLAFALPYGFSVGVGLNALYAASLLESRIGSGNLATDGRFKTTARNWGWGYHFGILYELNDCTRLGFNYHSEIDISGYGRAYTQLSASSPIIRQTVYSDLTLPDFYTFSIYHALNDQFALMADIQMVQWDKFKNFTLQFDNGSQLITRPDYKNALFFALGGTYQYNECWQFKIGGAFDKTATVDGSRPLYNPDQDQYYAAIGAQYRFSKNLAFDFGYVHVFYKKANINLSAPIAVGTQQSAASVQGRSRSHIEVFGLQVTWDLG